MSSGLFVGSFKSGVRQYFAVMRNKKKVSKAFTSRPSAECCLDRMEREALHGSDKERACMICATSFMSQHAGHRLCDSCRKNPGHEPMQV